MHVPKLLLYAFASLAALSSASAAKTIKLGTLAPQGTLYYDILRDMGEAWKRASHGAIELRIYPGGIAGDESDMVRKMRIGQLQAGALTGGGLADITSDIRAFQLPMMFRDFKELDYVRAGVRRRVESAFERKGFKFLTWGDAGWLYFFTKTPVIHPDDLKRHKIFSWAGNTTFVETWKDLGYQPVPMAATEIHLGLASGLITAMSVPPYAALSFQWFGQAKHMTDLKFAPLVGALIISKRSWNTVPRKARPAFLAAAARAGRRFQEVRHFGRKAIAVMQKHGLVVHKVPPRLVPLWEKRARRGWPRIVGKAVSADLVAEIKRLLARYRSRRP